jgi:predicted dehydrogenase
VADVNIESARIAASEFGVPDVYADYHELLDDDAIDVVVVCTPPFLHKEMSIDALRAGKHVLCEKPFATDVESANTMVAAAKETGYTLACCSARFRFTPVLKRAAAMIANGELGDVYFIRTVGIGRRGRPGLEYHPAARWFLDKNKAGGGALMDWGCYDLDMLWGLLSGLCVENVTGFA